MEYTRTRQVPERISFQEKTGLPNYVDQRVGHYIPNAGVHFHGHIEQRASALGNSQGVYGGRHETETRTRNIPTFQSSIFTKYNYEKNTGARQSDYPYERSSRTPPARTQQAEQRQYQVDPRTDNEIKAAIRSNGRADHVETIIKPNYPEPRFLAENTTYKVKHAVAGYARHYSPQKNREPIGKISATHWNVRNY